MRGSIRPVRPQLWLPRAAGVSGIPQDHSAFRRVTSGKIHIATTMNGASRMIAILGPCMPMNLHRNSRRRRPAARSPTRLF